MLQTLRNNTKIILWVTVIAFVGLIVLVWGADLQIGQRDPGTIGTVNGQPISYQVYQRLLNENYRNFRAQNNRDMTFDDEHRLGEQTWDMLVNEVLINQEAARLAQPVTDEELVFWIKSTPPPEIMGNPRFADDNGHFDIQRYMASLQQEPQAWVWYEQRLRQQLPADKLRQTVLASAKVSESEVTDRVRDLAEQRVITVAGIDPTQVDIDEQPLDEATLRAYYEEHLDEFMTGERARLRFVRIDKAASAEDLASVVEDLKGYRADVVKDLATSREEGEKTFAALATNFSEGPRADQGGDWGAARTRDAIRPPELAEQVFETPIGQVSQPFTAGNRYYIVMVTGEEDSTRTFSTIERILRAGPEQITVLRDQVRELVDLARSEGLQAAAASLGLTVQETEPFAAAGFVPELLGWREPVEFAFDNPVGAVGNPAEKEDAWVVYEVAERLAPAPRPFDQVQRAVERRLRQEQRREVARDDAEALASKVEEQGLRDGARAAGVDL
ncbi:MAG: SurA N-terminal domain-containing protein, partial [Candidatus Eiseniibacteriota bacterium]